MKMVWAVVRYANFERVERALSKLGQTSLSVTRVRGVGEEFTLREGELVGHLKVEVIVPDDHVTAVRDTILNAAWTGLPGDGLVAVLPVDECAQTRKAART